QGGNVADLEALRNRQYIVQGQSILCRPWRVEEQKINTWPSFGWLEAHIAEGKEGLPFSWPRNKSKALRNAISTGDQDAALVLEQANSQGHKLPDYPLAMERADVSRFAPYFDILEIEDMYQRRPGKGENAR
ncbi:MAG: hypothetical protein FWH34_07535, partial [Desulfovibrionaceae bacterium]|nr:hypothetical protein [Desulfovibrionaceae bacterium]